MAPRQGCQRFDAEAFAEDISDPKYLDPGGDWHPSGMPCVWDWDPVVSLVPRSTTGYRL